MIEGIKLDFTTDELASHLRGRIEHHKERQAFYKERAALLKGSEDAVQPNYSNAVRGNPVDQMESSATKHENIFKTFEIILSHLIPNETYRLEEDDLTRLEFTTRTW